MNPKTKGQFNKDTICTWSEEKDSCQGDSGGPLIKKDNESLVLVGLVSWGPEECAHYSDPGVFTDIRKYFDWINLVVSGKYRPLGTGIK